MAPIFASDEETTCVFVANLPAVLSNSELFEQINLALDRFGRILNIKTSRDNKNRPFAFVQFQGPVTDFLLTETVIIEGRVLRFEKAKRSFIPGSDEFGGGGKYNSSEPPKEFQEDASYYPQVHPQAYVPFYSYGNNSQLVHTFQIPHQTVVLYPPSCGPNFQFPQIPVSVVSAGTPEPVNSPVNFNSSNEELNKVFVGQLNGELVTQRKLLRRFQHHGHITDIELFKNNLDGSLRPEAFAFISYLKPEQVIQAIREEHGREWHGRRLKCCKALKKNESAADSSESRKNNSTSSSV